MNRARTPRTPSSGTTEASQRRRLPEMEAPRAILVCMMITGLAGCSPPLDTKIAENGSDLVVGSETYRFISMNLSARTKKTEDGVESDQWFTALYEYNGDNDTEARLAWKDAADTQGRQQQMRQLADRIRSDFIEVFPGSSPETQKKTIGGNDVQIFRSTKNGSLPVAAVWASADHLYVLLINSDALDALSGFVGHDDELREGAVARFNSLWP